MHKMRYKCYICGFETDVKSQIHIHHIIPKSLGGSNSTFNLITLCPTCHSKVYIPEINAGIHSIKRRIIISNFTLERFYAWKNFRV